MYSAGMVWSVSESRGPHVLGSAKDGLGTDCVGTPGESRWVYR